MKVFDGKKAAQDYMSAHTLAFSTPELTLMRFAFWLGDMVPDPTNKEKTIPRILTFTTEQDFEPVRIIDDDKYEPSGAVLNTNMYGNHLNESNPSSTNQSDNNIKFCPECGSQASINAKFCPDCGTTQD